MQSHQRPQLIPWELWSWSDPSELFQIRLGTEILYSFQPVIRCRLLWERWAQWSRWLFPVKDNQQEGELSCGLSAPSASRELDASILKGKSGKHTTEHTTVVVLYGSCYLHFLMTLWGWTSFGIWMASWWSVYQVLCHFLLSFLVDCKNSFTYSRQFFGFIFWTYIPKLSRIYNI